MSLVALGLGVRLYWRTGEQVEDPTQARSESLVALQVWDPTQARSESLVALGLRGLLPHRTQARPESLVALGLGGRLAGGPIRRKPGQ